MKQSLNYDIIPTCDILFILVPGGSPDYSNGNERKKRHEEYIGERKYDVNDDNCPIALWSHRLRFAHPVTGEQMDFAVQPPETYPWTLFAAAQEN